MPSGSRQPVTRVFAPEPSGLIEKTRPPLKSSTNSRSVAVSVAVERVDRDVCSCVMSTLQRQLAITAQLCPRVLPLRRRVFGGNRDRAARVQRIGFRRAEPHLRQNLCVVLAGLRRTPGLDLRDSVDLEGTADSG